MAARTARQVKPARRPAPKTAPARADLRVVRPDERVRTVGTISTVVAAFFFVVLFALAGLHAVVVQTQAELDEVNADINALEELRVMRLADLAWADSAVGLETTALAAGLVPAGETVILTPVPPGALAPPGADDPFSASAPGVAG
jgi:hypothetical protein